MSDIYCFIAVKEEAREQAPESVKRALDDFFERRDIFGGKFYVAINSDHRSPWKDRIDDPRYYEGLSQDERDNCGIFTWFDNHPDLVFQYDWSCS